MPLPPAPLSREEFASRLEPLLRPGTTRLAVAVSGGPDSTALALCAQRWGVRNKSDIVALLVDHRLRPESSAEAKITKQRLSAMGLSAEILIWEHPPVTKRLHVTAREARYALLFGACRARGIKDILIAHHREDQAETILMRFAKGSGLDGLAGMLPVTKREGLRLLRPFLSLSKARLIATCQSAGAAYITDPSNSAERYARGRLRRLETLLAEEGFTADRLIDLGERAREAKEALDAYTLDFLRHGASRDVAGTLRLDPSCFGAAPRAIALRSLSACFQALRPAPYPPERALMLALLEALTTSASMPPRTLRGVIVQKSTSAITLQREAATITESLSLAPGETALWDGRWQVRLAPQWKGPNPTLRALGTQPHATLDALAPGLRHKVPQGRARAALPALWDGDRLILIPDPLRESAAPATCRLMPCAWEE
ncbi:MAG: tRNA lysidine(34) synthetase TilS [Alphaproteobacteria bacterium]|nr:tRNA lysidine(34) synthetase TilS [Alphaproteobacteria bacterium]